jgi:hypothetical protein
MDLREIGCEGGMWMELAQDCVQWWALVFSNVESLDFSSVSWQRKDLKKCSDTFTGDGSMKQLKLLSETAIMALRHQSEVHCNRKSSVSSASNTSFEAACRPREAPCLFNICDDPCETTNLAYSRPLVLQSLEESLEQFRKTMVKPLNVPGDPMSNPAYWNDTWMNWKDDTVTPDDSIKVLPLHTSPPSTLSFMTVLSFIIVLSIVTAVMKLSVIVSPQKSSFFTKFLIKPKKTDMGSDQKGEARK